MTRTVGQLEHKELLEFEMLERAADLSQLSFSSDAPPIHTLPATVRGAGASKERQCDKDHSDNGLLDRKIFVLSPRSVSPSSEDVHDDDDDTDVDMDETLKYSNSLAKGMEFNDDEAWQSFNHGSPHNSYHHHNHCRTESSASDTATLSSTSSPPRQQPQSTSSPPRQGLQWTLSPPRQQPQSTSSPPRQGPQWTSPVKREVLREPKSVVIQGTLSECETHSSRGVAAVTKEKVFFEDTTRSTASRDGQKLPANGGSNKALPSNSGTSVS